MPDDTPSTPVAPREAGAAIPTLRTARLVLRPFEPADAPDVQRLAGEKAIAATTLNVPHPYPLEEAVGWISTHAERAATDEGVVFAIEHAGALVGAIGLQIERAHRRAELGYWIGVPYWGRGYATEAGRAVLAFGFGALGLNRIHASHLTRNPASGRVMQKLGMRFEGVRREHIVKWDVPEDLATYSTLAREFTPGE